MSNTKPEKYSFISNHNAHRCEESDRITFEPILELDKTMYGKTLWVFRRTKDDVQALFHDSLNTNHRWFLGTAEESRPIGGYQTTRKAVLKIAEEVSKY
jgi:hypothetical protein